MVGMVRTAVLGASGFTGGELLRLLAAHPTFRVIFLGGGSSAGRELAEVQPHLRELPLASLPIRRIDPEAIATEADLVFSALPHGESALIAPALLEAGCTVIDLAGDFRIDAADYPAWYGFEHPAPAWIDKAVYGLPELFGERLPGARLVANPGCFPTAVVVGCAPLIAAGLVAPDAIRVDGKTGLSGAGRSAVEATSFAASEDAIRPYRAPHHQHTPEIERALELANGSSATVTFVPHLVPAVRGVLATTYATLLAPATTSSLTECLVDAYGIRPFVRVLPPGGMVDTKRTRGTNVVELQAIADERTGSAIVIGALDNLGKGAAGQAIQNANLVLGLEEATGLPTIAAYP
jgi:N-acetyl-gamma-glutamyl-phosphate reductase